MEIGVICSNTHKYPVSAMCEVLQIPKVTYYYIAKSQKNNDDEITDFIIRVFKDSCNIYVQRKIKKLYKLGHQVAIRWVGLIMKEQGIVSKYTVAQFRVAKSSVN